MYTIKCPNCGFQNKNTNIRCESCGTKLIHSEENMATVGKWPKYVIGIIFGLVLLPIFLSGLVFFGAGLYGTITYYQQSKNYLKTEGRLVDYENCYFDEDSGEICQGVYEYTVNDVTYRGFPDFSRSRSDFKQTITVKYNPDNPSEYIINSATAITTLIFGFFMAVLAAVLFILTMINADKELKKINNIELDN